MVLDNIISVDFILSTIEDILISVSVSILVVFSSKCSICVDGMGSIWMVGILSIFLLLSLIMDSVILLNIVLE